MENETCLNTFPGIKCSRQRHCFPSQKSKEKGFNLVKWTKWLGQSWQLQGKAISDFFIIWKYCFFITQNRRTQDVLN